MQIIEKEEAKEQNLQYYFTGKLCRKGHKSKRYTSNQTCYLCTKEYDKNRYQLLQNRLKKNNYNYWLKNKEKYAKLNHKYYTENTEHVKNRTKNWQSNNPEQNAFNSATYRARKLSATPSWTNLEAIKEIYKNCPKGHHVDHIIPLKNKLVCGLHVPENLQYLTSQQNSSKTNSFMPRIELQGCLYVIPHVEISHEKRPT